MGSCLICHRSRWKRYQVDRVASPFALWRLRQKCRQMRAGSVLRLEVLSPARLHWSLDDWQTVQDTVMLSASLGVYTVDLPSRTFALGMRVRFPFYWQDSQQWEGVDYAVAVLG